MNGMQAARIIRDELQDNTPIIAMTASAMRGEKENCIAAGMNDYISKPFEPHELNRMIYAYLPHSDEAPQARILDLDFLKKLVNNETQLIKEILELYIAKTPAALADLAAQLAEKNYDALYNEIHNLKNSVGLFGQGKLYMLLNEVEAGLYERVPDAPTIARIGMLKAGVTQSVKEAQEALQTMQ